jgi:uncharacterized membrane protein
MKTMGYVSIFAIAVSCLGCGGGGGTPGGPGAKTNGGKDRGTLGTAEETFTINVPNTSTKLKQGESKSITLSLRRGKNFDEDVVLKFDNLPKGLTIEPSRPEIAKSEEEVAATVKAAKDAAVGDFTIKVTGEPSRGQPATNTLKVTIEKPGS